MVLEEEYFQRSAVELAPDLVGKLLCRQTDNGVLRLRITETECYFGEEDTACHAHKGRTPRTDVMYGKGGRAYIYLCYGIHYLLNFTTGPEGHPEAVLIRGVSESMGPGRVTKRMQIGKELNRCMLSPDNGLWVEDDGYVPKIAISTRIGVGYADQKDAEKPWRFTEVGQ